MTARGETGRGKPKSGAEGASWGNSESLRQKNSCLTQLWREFCKPPKGTSLLLMQSKLSGARTESLQTDKGASLSFFVPYKAAQPSCWCWNLSCFLMIGKLVFSLKSEGGSRMLKRTPLFDLYKEYGGKTIDFGRWELPVQFSSIKEEHEAVRTKAGLFVDKRCFDAERRRRPVYGYVLWRRRNDRRSPRL